MHSHTFYAAVFYKSVGKESTTPVPQKLETVILILIYFSEIKSRCAAKDSALRTSEKLYPRTYLQNMYLADFGLLYLVRYYSSVRLANLSVSRRQNVHHTRAKNTWTL